MKSKKRVSKVPQRKVKEVEYLKNLIKTKKTVLLASIKNIPASQFQEIGKKLRGKAVIKVPKKNLIFMALDSSGKEATKGLKEKIVENTAVLFSDLDSFDLASELIKNKSPAKAKPGQEAPEDIIIEAGPTELVPGPAITELGALGIQIQIEKGKIHIKVPKTIAKKGEKISQGAADLMGKLDIKPFTIGFIPICALDVENGKIYSEMNIDTEKAVNDLKTLYGKALALAVAIEYPCHETIRLLISKAGSQERRLNRVMSGEPEEVAPQIEVKEETPKEEKKEAGPSASAEGLASLFG